jgi:hypothetical protein
MVFLKSMDLYSFKIIFAAYGCYSVVNGYEDVKDYELSMFSKVKQTFVTSLHLVCKDPNLESDLLLSPLGSSWVCQDLGFNECVNFKGTGSLASRTISNWLNLYVSSL